MSICRCSWPTPGNYPKEEVRAAKMLAHDVDGFVVLSPRRLHRELEALGSSADRLRAAASARVILPCSSGAPQRCTKHSPIWLPMGIARLSFLGGPTGSWAATERRAAVQKASLSMGLDVAVVNASAPTFEAATEAVGPDSGARGDGSDRLQRSDGARA